MAIWSKIYSLIGWENQPSTKTPINATNLGKMDSAIDELDNRVLELKESGGIPKNQVENILGNFASEYDSTLTYAVGDYVVYDGLLYKCVTAITTAESFDSSKWVKTDCGTEFTSKLPLKGVLTATIDAVLDDGIYFISGPSVGGTFPNLAHDHYGILCAYKRYDACYQHLICTGGSATRRVNADNTATLWMIGGYRREVHEVEGINISEGAVVEQTIMFDTAFTEIPMVTVDLRGAGTRTLAQLNYVSTTNCKVKIYAEDGKAQTGRGIRVMAMGY